jgi:hypothetical protein
MRNHFLIGILVLFAAVVGCGKKEKPKLAVTPVKGTITVAGQPKAKIQLRFHPKEPFKEPTGNILAPVATSDEQGNFAPSTYDSFDGLPTGEYSVTGTYPSIHIDQGEEIMGPDQWQGRYNAPKNPLATITVGAEPLEIPKIDVK